MEKLYEIVEESADETLKVILKICILIAESERVFIFVCILGSLLGAFIVYSFTKMILNHRKEKEEYRIIERNSDTLDKVKLVLVAFKEKFNITKD